MTEEQQTVLLIRGAITQLPEDQQKIVMDHYRQLKEAVEREYLVGLAVALVGAELAATAE